MDFIQQYGTFLAEIATTVVAILVVALGLLAIFSKDKSKSDTRIEVKHINKKYKGIHNSLQSQLLDKKAYKEYIKTCKKQEKISTTPDKPKKRVFVVKFDGDIKASAVTHLREEITAILMVATPQDEVVVLIDSGGGMVHCYGLASSQLQRVRDHMIPLTIIIDKLAASGGYMMACVGNQILAAPFAIVGSVGVVGQLPNFRRWLKSHDIDYEQETAGEYKRTLTMFGENTEKAREKFRSELNETHDLFKQFVAAHRPQLDLNIIATGEHWYGLDALEKNLVDKLMTSDDYLLTTSKTCELYSVVHKGKKSLSERFAATASATFSKVFFRWQKDVQDARFT